MSTLANAVYFKLCSFEFVSEFAEDISTFVYLHFFI